MQTCHTAKNTDQQFLMIKELLANARQQKEIQVDKNAVATAARERANLKA